MATSHMRSITSNVLASRFRLLFSNPPAPTTHVHEFSESHSEHKSIEGMRTSCSPDINEVSVQVNIKINGADLATILMLICVNRT